MDADPNKNTSVIYADAIRDLNLIREDVAASARAASDGDNLPYRARLLQAKQMMSLVSFFNGSWPDAYCAVQREYGAQEAPTADAVEASYSQRLIAKLESTLETAWVSFGGRPGEVAIRARHNAFEADIAVETAKMIHECIGPYAETYIGRLRDRLSELTEGVGPKP